MNKLLVGNHSTPKADKNNKSVKDLIWLLFETAILTLQFSLEESNIFGNSIHRILK